jgi:hydrogenase expression/formation protein HypC
MCLGIPGCIVKIDDAENMIATADISGVRRQVNIGCIVDDDHPPQSCLGEWVLIHVGFAMSRIDAEQAAETLRVLSELGEMQAEIETMRAADRGILPARNEGVR